MKFIEISMLLEAVAVAFVAPTGRVKVAVEQKCVFFVLCVFLAKILENNRIRRARVSQSIAPFIPFSHSQHTNAAPPLRDQVHLRSTRCRKVLSLPGA